MRSAVIAALCGIRLSAPLGADERTVLLDEEIDFNAFSTFSLSNGVIASERGSDHTGGNGVLITQG